MDILYSVLQSTKVRKSRRADKHKLMLKRKNIEKQKKTHTPQSHRHVIGKAYVSSGQERVGKKKREKRQFIKDRIVTGQK